MTLLQKVSLVALAILSAQASMVFAAGGRVTPHDDSYDLTVRFCDTPSELCNESLKIYRAFVSAEIAAEARFVAQEQRAFDAFDAAQVKVSKMPPGTARVRARRKAFADLEAAHGANFDQKMAVLSEQSVVLAAQLLRHRELANQRVLKRFGFFGHAISRTENTRLLLQEPGTIQYYVKLLGVNVDFIRDCRTEEEDSFRREDHFVPEEGDGSLLVQLAEEAGRGLTMKISVDAGILRKIDNCGEPESPQDAE